MTSIWRNVSMDGQGASVAREKPMALCADARLAEAAHQDGGFHPGVPDDPDRARRGIISGTDARKVARLIAFRQSLAKAVRWRGRRRNQVKNEHRYTQMSADTHRCAVRFQLPGKRSLTW
jgi:hypothetical protein